MNEESEGWKDLNTVYCREDLSAPEPVSPDSLGPDGDNYDPAL